MDAHADLTTARVSYESGALNLADALNDPLAQFATWLAAAQAHPELREPYAMTVATVDRAGQPSARIVLLRGFDAAGFVFFTNYDSRKGRELDAVGKAALLWYWDRLEREVRIEGRVERLGAAESDTYFAKRPRGHRLSAWASPQSQVVADRAELEAAMAKADTEFPGDVPRPEYWGGYRVVPQRYEFWQGRANRVHDRLQYDNHDGAWQIVRLAP